MASCPDWHVGAMNILEQKAKNSLEVTLRSLNQKGAIFADARQYQCSVDVWLDAFDLAKAEGGGRVPREARKTLQSLCMVLLEMDEAHTEGTSKESVKYDDVKTVFDAICDEVEASHRDDDFTKPGVVEEFDMVIRRLLHLMHLLDKIAVERNQALALRYRLHRLLRANICVEYSGTLLHIAMDPNTSAYGPGGGDLSAEFPNEAMTLLLVGCGAEVNAKNNLGDTPLHSFSRLACNLMDKKQAEVIADILISNGSHIDARNNRGDFATRGLERLSLDVLKTKRRVSGV
ncbi:hypothetical protein CAPTEDRAFT_195886 [Capitella teleta]|uniref:Uncharacterized protein n=1 Tax=Capitella teleta TaxID=283909 RepID=R7TYR0_CAPTE|nr:hypothetical protein CAPTEDRAFT_195886 [Capitella teleta]|eukprot:ELT98854.1 hypothetical protein CAPTEDRAFT_195886 [Capitella teleta]